VEKSEWGKCPNPIVPAIKERGQSYCNGTAIVLATMSRLVYSGTVTREVDPARDAEDRKDALWRRYLKERLTTHPQRTASIIKVRRSRAEAFHKHCRDSGSHVKTFVGRRIDAKAANNSEALSLQVECW
jgi:hypothetical protein